MTDTMTSQNIDLSSWDTLYLWYTTVFGLYNWGSFLCAKQLLPMKILTMESRQMNRIDIKTQKNLAVFVV